MPIRDWDNVLSFVKDRINTPGERRQVVRSFTPELISEGYTQTAIKSLFRSNDLGISNQAFSDIWQDYAVDNDLYAEYSTLSDNDELAENVMSVNSNLNDRKFRWSFDVYYESQEENRFILGSFSLADDTNRTVGELKEELSKILTEVYNVSPENIQSMNLTRAYVVPDNPFG